MPRTDGRKIVAFAFGATALAVGIGQIYLPYIADKDKLRGLFEEEDMPLQARREMEMMMRQDQQDQEKGSGGSGRGGVGVGVGAADNKGKNGAGSMWQNLRRN